MTYFRMGNPHYHRRAAVSRSCSGWEGVVPAGYGRQALSARAASAARGEEVGVGSIDRSASTHAARERRSVMGSSRTGD